MPESSVTLVRGDDLMPVRVEAEAFDQLKELVANGYVPDSGAPGEAGILLRHKSAPDLVLHANGRIEVPIGQPAKGLRRLFNWRGWLKFIALVVLGFVFWLVSLTASTSTLEWMGQI